MCDSPFFVGRHVGAPLTQIRFASIITLNLKQLLRPFRPPPIKGGKSYSQLLATSYLAGIAAFYAFTGIFFPIFEMFFGSLADLFVVVVIAEFGLYAIFLGFGSVDGCCEITAVLAACFPGLPGPGSTGSAGRR